jgi:hypothetical protein
MFADHLALHYRMMQGRTRGAVGLVLENLLMTPSPTKATSSLRVLCRADGRRGARDTLKQPDDPPNAGGQ